VCIGFSPRIKLFEIAATNGSEMDYLGEFPLHKTSIPDPFQTLDARLQLP
jgi:hypothetical protein